MKEIEIEIEGVTPLLMHSAQNMEEQSMKKNPTKVYDHNAYAKKVAYINKKGNLYVPSRCVKASILNASSWYKFGKKSAKQIMAGCTTIQPFEIELLDATNKPIKKYEIDLQPVVVQRARIIRARPRIDNWRMKFTIVYNDTMISDTSNIEMIIEEAGQRIGLLDNRPQKFGEYGTFKLVKFKEKK